MLRAEHNRALLALHGVSGLGSFDRSSTASRARVLLAFVAALGGLSASCSAAATSHERASRRLCSGRQLALAIPSGCHPGRGA
jgi:hypothetical protein